MACSIFDDRDGFIDEADPVSPLSNPDAGTGTAVLERPEEETKLDDGGNGDADRFAHYVSRDRIAESRRTGRPVVALCGKVWVPSRNPERFPVCPTCKEIWESMKPGKDKGKSYAEWDAQRKGTSWKAKLKAAIDIGL